MPKSHLFLFSRSDVKQKNTYEQLAVELQVNVSVSRSFLRSDRKLVHPESRLLHVALGSDPMPAVVVQRDVGLHADLQRAVANVEGEHDASGS